MNLSDFLRGTAQMASPVPGVPAQPRAAQPQVPARPAPVEDDATARAQRLAQVLPSLVSPVDRALNAVNVAGSSVLGTGLSLFGATEMGANQFRAADAFRGQRTPQPTQMVQPDAAPMSGEAQSGMRVTNLSSPENAAQVEQLRQQQVLSGLNATALGTLLKTVPQAATPMAPKDRAIEDVRQIAFSNYEQVLNDETASVEMKSAATRELLATLLELSGANSFAAMAGQ